MSNYTFTPHELRIGSVVNYITSEGAMICTLDWEDFELIQNHNDYFNSFHQPIPITPEFLVKMGLEKEDNCFFFIESLAIEYIPEENVYRVYIRGHFVKKITYIHQLQSIVFDLIGVWCELNSNNE